MHLNNFVSIATILMPSALAINWSVQWYPDHAACMGDDSGIGTAGDENDILWCLGAAYTHDVETANIEAAGKHVHLYTDAACTNEIANIASNGCHVTPEDISKVADAETRPSEAKLMRDRPPSLLIPSVMRKKWIWIALRLHKLMQTV